MGDCRSDAECKEGCQCRTPSKVLPRFETRGGFFLCSTEGRSLLDTGYWSTPSSPSRRQSGEWPTVVPQLLVSCTADRRRAGAFDNDRNKVLCMREISDSLECDMGVS